MKHAIGIAMVFALFLGRAEGISAALITLDAVDSGSYDATGFHQDFNRNYLVGRSDLNDVFNNFFVFSLSGIVPGTITNAQLRIFNPGGPFPEFVGYSSPDPTETYTVFDVSTATPTLLAGGSGLTDIFADLGSGVAYGSQTVSAADNGNFVPVVLNPTALVDLNTAAGGLFAFGGANTTLGAGQERFFRFSDEGVGQLVLEATTIPEPSMFVLFGTGVLGLVGYIVRGRLK